MATRKILGACLLVTGVLVIACSLPLGLGLVPPNPWFGIRFPQGFTSIDNWYRLNRFGGTALAIWGVSALGAGCLLVSRIHLSRRVALALGLFYPLTLVIPVLITYLYALHL